MSVVYKSKVNIWMVCLVIVIAIVSLVPVILFAFSWTAVLISFGLFAFIIYCFCSTKYIITNNILNIKCGFLINEKINIANIVKILPIKSISAAPAASLDRIGIYLNRQHTPIIISPKNKAQFIDSLKSINPNISSRV